MIDEKKLLMLADPATYATCGVEKKWRVMRTFADIYKCELVAYQDARDVQKVLDYVCGPENWANEAVSLNGRLYMTISINVNGEWVSKTDVGTESNVEKIKGESSDALKRAAVMWGVFRNLYEEETIILSQRAKVPLTANGKELRTAAQISAYCNGLNSEMGKLMAIYKAFEVDFRAEPAALAALTEIKNFLTKIKE